MKPCWSCESNAECYDGCECAKCVDREGYQDWKENNPEDYERWLEVQKEDDY